MLIALGQLDCRAGDTRANATRLEEVLAAACAAGAGLAVLPELQLSGYALRGLDEDTACTAEEIAALAPGSPAALVGFHERADGGRYSSAAYVEGGVAVHVHRKLYLCDYEPFCEDELFVPGDRLQTFDTALGRVAVLICNDAWQPFLPALAAHDGAEILLVPAASSTAVPEAEQIWRQLTRLYAQLFACYVVFVNRVGSEGAFTFWGGSHVVDPFGEVVAEAPRLEEALLFAELDLDRVAARRRELPVRRDLRPELLRAELARRRAVWHT